MCLELNQTGTDLVTLKYMYLSGIAITNATFGVTLFKKSCFFGKKTITMLAKLSIFKMYNTHYVNPISILGCTILFV